jgi:uncharacterized protein YjiS (DUF1127 family)
LPHALPRLVSAGIDDDIAADPGDDCKRTAMYANTERKPFIAPEPSNPPAATRHPAPARANLPARNADNDPACDDASSERRELDRWWRHAAAASGFADVVDASLESTYDLYGEARARRAAMVARLAATALRSTAAFLRRAYARYHQRREACAVSAALHELDDRTLHDLGFDRSEIGSVAMEAAGLTARTRVRIV